MTKAQSTTTEYPIESGVPMIETRGRHASEEHIKLLSMAIGQSFFSPKRRETLYQCARSIGVKVRILTSEWEGIKGYRVWKRSHPDPVLAERRRRKPREKREDSAKL